MPSPVAQANGRERWWRTVSADMREPDYDSLCEPDLTALDDWRASQIPDELVLVNRFIGEARKHGPWARSSRANGYYTADDLDALMNDYIAQRHKYGHSGQDAPPGALFMQLRMFHLPDEPAEPEEPAKPAESGS